MMKTRYFNILLLTAAISFGPIGAKAPVAAKAPITKNAPIVGHVDPQKIVAESKHLKAKSESIQTDLQKEAAPLEASQKSIQSKQAKLDKAGTDMKPEAKKKLEAEVQSDTQVHMMKAKAFQAKAQSKEQEFMKDFQDLLKTVAKDLGLDMLVFPGASVVANDDHDHTKAITEAIDKKHPVKPSAKK
jgi:Skp family chaperone for outer membrane proteins